jgi:hypothetical protein
VLCYCDQVVYCCVELSVFVQALGRTQHIILTKELQRKTLPRSSNEDIYKRLKYCIQSVNHSVLSGKKLILSTFFKTTFFGSFFSYVFSEHVDTSTFTLGNIPQDPWDRLCSMCKCYTV